MKCKLAKSFKLFDFQDFDISNNHISQKMNWYLACIVLKISWRLKNQEQLVWGVMLTSARSENNENDWFSSFPKMNPKSYKTRMKQNHFTELLGHFLLKCKAEMTSQTP